MLGGLVGLGGAEFRLPLLLSVFGFAALSAVILNKAMSLVVVVVAIPARLGAVPFHDVVSHSESVLNLLAGSLLGAWFGASWATRIASATLYRVLAGLLVLIALVFAAERAGSVPSLGLSGALLLVTGVAAGFGIGYSQDQAFAVLRENRAFVAAMAVGSVAGSVAGGVAAGFVTEAVIVPVLVVLLLFSAFKVWRH